MLLFEAAPRAEVRDLEDPLGPEREALIHKIVVGEDTATCARAFTQLLRRRDELIAAAQKEVQRLADEEAARKNAEQAAVQATALAQKRAEEEAQRRELQAEAARKKLEAERQAYLDSIDHNAGNYCYLVVDPHQRHFKGGVSADWGKVVRKAQVRLPAENAFSDERVFTMYEIAGVREHHFLRGDIATQIKAEIGDLIFLGDPYGNADRHLPKPWDEVPLANAGYTVRIAAPPAIAKKAKWNPIHVKLGDIANAIKAVNWALPQERFIVANLRVGAALSPGRFAIEAYDASTTFVLEVPSDLPRKDLIKPDEWVWVIMGSPRFDRTLKKLILVAADVESRYLVEKP